MDFEDVIHSPNRSKINESVGDAGRPLQVIHASNYKETSKHQRDLHSHQNKRYDSSSTSSKSKTTMTSGTSTSGTSHTTSYIDDNNRSQPSYEGFVSAPPQHSHTRKTNQPSGYYPNEYHDDSTLTNYHSRDAASLLDGHDVSSLAIYLKEKKLDAGLHDVKSVLKRLQFVLEEKEARVAGLESQCEAQSETITELHREIQRLRSANEFNKNAIESGLKRQLAQVTDEAQQRLVDNQQLKKELDEALWSGQDFKKRAEIASNQAEDLRIGLEKLRADYDLLISRAEANEEQMREFSDARQGIRGKHESQLAIMEMKYASLQNQCADLKQLKEELEDRLREAQLRNNEHSLKSQHRVLMESAEIHRKAQENVNLEEQLHIAHVNNCRLLRLLMETSEFSQLVEFNSASQSFDFIRGPEGEHTNIARQNSKRSEIQNSTGILGSDVVSGSYHDPHTHSTRSKNVRLNKLSAKHQAMHVAVECENEYIKSSRNASSAHTLSKTTGALTVVPSSTSHAAAPVHAASGPAAFMCRPHPFYPTTDSGGPLRPRELIDFKHEAHYWIPHAAFIAAQKWRDSVCPEVSINVFSSLFWSLNEIWRERMRQRLEVQAKELKQRAHMNGESLETTTKGSAGAARNEFSGGGPPSETELANLRREVKAKVFSRTALQLFDQYEMALKRLVARTQRLEADYARTMASKQRADNLRGPSETVLHDRLDACANTARLVSSQLEQKLTAASQDVARFLRAVESSAVPDAAAVRGQIRRQKAYADLNNDMSAEVTIATSASMIPASLLLRVTDFMLEFTSEVSAQVEGVALTLRASADACDSVLLQQREFAGQMFANAKGHSGRADGQNISFEEREGARRDSDYGVIRGGDRRRRRATSAGVGRRLVTDGFIPDEDDVVRR